MTGTHLVRGIIVAMALVFGTRAHAQTCDDANECTMNDMCSDDECTGTPQTGGGCDDVDDCTVNDRCQLDPALEQIICRGDPAPNGTTCSAGCGTCQAISEVASTCLGTPENAGMPCDPGFGPCLDGSCQLFIGNVTTCVPEFVECPDTDGNPCTDNCNFETGACEVNAPKCFEPCEACDAGSGECAPANLGGACEDFNVCSSDSRCEQIDIGGGLMRGFCLPGESTGPTPTVPPGGDCVGDCNDNGVVAVNELIIGVTIALDTAEVSECLAFDANANGGVEVNELVSGVNALLNGCA